VELTDTHCHLDLDVFAADLELVLERAAASGVGRYVVPSLDRDSGSRIIALAEHHPSVFAAIGVHPSEARRLEESDLSALRSLATHPKVVAVGEIGLDYYWVTDSAGRELQRKTFGAQLDLAGELGRPVVVHLREEGDAKVGACADDMLALLEEWVDELRSSHVLQGRPAGVLHSFSGSLETAMQAIRLGFFIGVTGPVTYPAAEDRRRIISNIPLDRLLIETDAPFLAPIPHRGRRNEPAFVAYIADRIAQIQSRTSREVAEATTANARRLFGWGESV
jgi:TatD DNase family protein